MALALCLAIAAAGGCKSKHSSPTGADTDFGSNDPAVVVALGDSITFGVLDTNVETCDESNRNVGGFCPPLQSLTGKIVINQGICGTTSYSGANRIDGVLQRWRPGVILIDYGANDLIFGSAGAVIGNLRIMVDAARANGTVPVLGTLLPTAGPEEGRNPAIVSLNAQILDLCAELNLECADHHAAFVKNKDFQDSPDALLSDDGLHPNHEGYALMADTWRGPLMRVY